MDRRTLLIASLALAACNGDAYEFDFDTLPVEVGGDGTDATDLPADGVDADDPGVGVDTRDVPMADTDASGDTPGDADADRERGAIGAPCARNSDCASGVCIPVGGGVTVCTQPCGAGCPAGWTCGDGEVVCGCEASIEICDGADNDCDAAVDEGAGFELGCDGAELCTEGACLCPAALGECGGRCTDLASDRFNCGACDVRCTNGESCVGGDCVCPDGSSVCGGLCIDVTEDPLNCGDCGVACPEELRCVDGGCACAGATEAFCFGACVDVATDTDNCGECGLRCRRTEVCLDGDCTCADGETLCSGVCIDTASDPSHCGRCGNACTSGRTCIDGACACPEGTTLCDGACVHTATDALHCGDCSTRCDEGDVCAAGACGCPPGFIGCAGGCVDPETDSDNCGDCDIACLGGDACVEGACACPCGGTSCDDGTCLVLARSAPSVSRAYTFTPDTRLQADVAVLMDTTGSMGAYIASLRSSILSTILPAARSAFTTVGIGVTGYADFPCGGGGTTDRPFSLYQRVTTDSARAAAAIDALAPEGGGDYPETGWEALYQIATGAGRDESCASGREVNAFDPASNRVAGVADGTIGGVGFRAGSLPIVVLVTDALSHERGVSSYAWGATSTEARAALEGIGARVVGVGAGAGLPAFVTAAVSASGARVPPCAWDGARPSGCAAGQCCTGTATLAGGGVPADAEGLCPLSYQLPTGTSALGAPVAGALSLIGRFSAFDVRLNVVRDEAAFADAGIDTTCLVTRVRAGDVVDAPACGPTPVAYDANGDTVLDAFSGMTASVSVDYELQLRNLCISTPGVYPVHFEVRAGSTVFARRTLYVRVP